MGFDERLLEGVLALALVGEHVPAVGEQRCVMALEDRLEGPLVARLHRTHERVIACPGMKAVAIHQHHPQNPLEVG